jgi:hypothetical protein
MNNRDEIEEIREDVEWAMSGKGGGWIEAKDALALLATIDELEAIIEAMLSD